MSVVTITMPLESDLTLVSEKFGPEAASRKTKDLNDKLTALMAIGPEWHQVSLASHTTVHYNLP